MQLLTSDIGWTLVQHSGVVLRTLYWTENGGTDWNIIRPPAFSPQGISSTFFLDTKRGWALSCGFGRALVFSTTNSAADWSITNVDIPGLPPERINNREDCQIYFADSLHGWISFTAENANGSKSGLLVTSDGGRTWDPASNDIGKMGYLRFVTPMDGWMLVPSSDELYVARDGAKSWGKVSLAAPREIYPATEATYDLPTFEDSNHGFLPVTYSGGLGVKAAAVLFATEDGGQTWKSDRILANLNGMPVGNWVASAVAGPAWITLNRSDDNNPTITAIASGATVNASSNATPGYYGARQLIFVTPTRGWVLLNDGQALSTMDGGATWSDLVFSPNLPVVAPHPAPRP